MKWRCLSVDKSAPEQVQRDALRLNSLGSLFFFAYTILGKKRLSKIHSEWCQSLEREDLHLVMECPMGHFKTTLAIALSIWWALPFTARDEYMMSQLGLPDSWIRWMHLAHNPNTRTLVTHEIESRAIAMGKEVDEHYTNNDLFRWVFPEILPDNTTTWNDHTKFQKRFGRSDATTGTYEYRGVGQALQGIHPDSTIQDDNMGRAAQQSMLRGDGRVLEDLIGWHRQLTTRIDTAAFDKDSIGRQLVVGNRWGHRDLNSWIRENQKQYSFESHSAEGGCCAKHPAGKSIFPEEWSMERLTQKREDIGLYDYSSMYLNSPILPNEVIFQPDWLRYYNFKPSRSDLPLEHPDNWLMLSHEVYDGKTIDDLNAGVLQKRMIVDLAHAKKIHRCNHVILIAGWDSESDRIYLLDVWAKPTQYSDLVNQIYKMARKWGMRDMWLETVAAQNLLKFYLEERNTRESRPVYVNELPYDNSANAKQNRIEALEPIFKNGQFWCHKTHTEFTREYNTYPASPTVDVLDCLGYLPSTLKHIGTREVLDWVKRQSEDFSARPVGPSGY